MLDKDAEKEKENTKKAEILNRKNYDKNAATNENVDTEIGKNVEEQEEHVKDQHVQLYGYLRNISTRFSRKITRVDDAITQFQNNPNTRTYNELFTVKDILAASLDNVNDSYKHLKEFYNTHPNIQKKCFI